MSGELDNELRADFVAESGDLLETLGGQLVELEKRPDDTDLLNAIFRGFHTIKGGAGFFELNAIVVLCHAAEDVFNLLRNRSMKVTAEVMDFVQAAVDELRTMLDAVARNLPVPEPQPMTLEGLHALAEGYDEPMPPELMPEPAAAKPAGSASAEAAAAIAADPFSEDEFEALLDQLHGAGAAPSVPVAAVPAEAASEPVSLPNVQELLHPTPPTVAPAESAAPLPRPQPPAKGAATVTAHAEPVETTVRIETERLDQVMNLVGELVLVRNRLKLSRNSVNEATRRSFGELDHITSTLQAAVMRMRMQPIRKLLSKFPRMARDVARKLDKQVEIELRGEETELDKSLVEALNDPLVHMVRNAIDHGIESPATRRAAGKTECGHIMLSAEQAGDHILINVQDDGGGIDAERLRRKAIERGQIDPQLAATLSQEACLQLIFLPGLSTKEQVSDLSGRGVGMDAVRASVAALNGSIHIESVLGHGTAFQIRVPLTLAIQPVLMLALGRRVLALPLQPVQDVFILDESQVRMMDRWDAVLYRGETLRLIRLTKWSGVDDAVAGNGAHVVVVRVGVERYGLIVGTVRGREEIVVKPLGRMLRGLAGVGGATITGDGRVALILDPPGLVAAYAKSL